MKNILQASVLAIASLACAAQAQGHLKSEGQGKQGLSGAELLGILGGLNNGQGANAQKAGQHQAQGAVAGVGRKGENHGGQAQGQGAANPLILGAVDGKGENHRGQQQGQGATRTLVLGGDGNGKHLGQGQAAQIRTITIGAAGGHQVAATCAAEKTLTVTKVEKVAVAGGAGNDAVQLSFVTQTVFQSGAAPTVTVTPLPQMVTQQVTVTVTAAAAAVAPAPQQNAAKGVQPAVVDSVNTDSQVAAAVPTPPVPVAAASSPNPAQQPTAAPAPVAATPILAAPPVGASGGLAQGTGTMNANGQCDCACMCASGSFPPTINVAPQINAATTLQTLASASNPTPSAVIVSTNIAEAASSLAAGASSLGAGASSLGAEAAISPASPSNPAPSAGLSLDANTNAVASTDVTNPSTTPTVAADVSSTSAVGDSSTPTPVAESPVVQSTAATSASESTSASVDSAQSAIEGSSASAAADATSSPPPIALAQSVVAATSAGASPPIALTSAAAASIETTSAPSINIATFQLTNSLELGNLAMPTISV